MRKLIQSINTDILVALKPSFHYSMIIPAFEYYFQTFVKGFANLFQNCNLEVVWIFIFFGETVFCICPPKAPKIDPEIPLLSKASKPK